MLVSVLQQATMIVVVAAEKIVDMNRALSARAFIFVALFLLVAGIDRCHIDLTDDDDAGYVGAHQGLRLCVSLRVESRVLRLGLIRVHPVPERDVSQQACDRHVGRFDEKLKKRGFRQFKNFLVGLRDVSNASDGGLVGGFLRVEEALIKVVGLNFGTNGAIIVLVLIGGLDVALLRNL